MAKLKAGRQPHVKRYFGLNEAGRLAVAERGCR